MSIFNPEIIISTLGKYHVRYVLIGALAARLQGFPRVTADIDITPAKDSENLQNLATALIELDARVFTESVPEGLVFDCTGISLAKSEMWNLITSSGRIDIAFKPAGTLGYHDLMNNAVQYSVYGFQIFAASLEDIIRSKKVSDRTQDRQDIIILNEILSKKNQ